MIQIDPKTYFIRVVITFCLIFSVRPLFSETHVSNQIKKSYDKAVELFSMGNYDESLHLFNSIYYECLKTYGQNTLIVANVLANIGTLNYQLSLYDKAIENYLKAEDIYNQIGEKSAIMLASVHVNIALCYMKNGDMGNALPHFENSERIFGKLQMSKSPEYESLLNNLTAYYINNSDFKKALAYNEKAFKISTEELKEHIKWNSRGFIFYKKNDFHKSLKCYKTALQTMIRDHGSDFAGVDLIFSNIGLVYLDLKDYDLALEYFDKAKDQIKKTRGEKNTSYSMCLNRIGLVSKRREEYASDIQEFCTSKKRNITSALKIYQQALSAISPDFTSLDYSNNPSIESVIDKTQLLITLKNKAEALKELSELEEKTGNHDLCIRNLEIAIKTYQIAGKVIHLIRTGFISEESRLLLADNEHSVFIGAIEAAVHLYKLTGKRQHFELAFEFSERSRSTDFLTMVQNTRAMQFGGMPDTLLQKETELKSEIAAYKNFVFSESSKKVIDQQKLDQRKNKLFNLELSYSKLIKLFEQNYPAYYEFKYADPIVTLEEVQAKLKAREALIEYVVKEPSNEGSGKILSFVITKSKFNIHEQEVDTTYYSAIEEFQQFLKNAAVYNTRKKEFNRYSMAAYRLHNLLVAPFSKEIEGCRLIIVPDGKLSYLPFDAFLTSVPDTSKMDFRGLNYLLYDHAVSYSYSATLLYHYFKSLNKAENELIAFVPKYQSYPIISNNRDNNNLLLPLPGAEIEVEEISKLLDCKTYIDKEATSHNFEKNASQYDILHLAMHTLINDSLPMYSKLVFSGRDNEQSINTYEIYNMDFKARMAVLSACNTGNGRLQKGEGVMSLARAFLYAGCPSIVMTLWSVEDEVSADLMINFYKNILNGYPKDEALRKAKIKYIQSADPLKAHPHFWMGYVSIGNQLPLFKTKTINFILMSLFILVAVVSEKFYEYLKNKKKKFR